MVSIIIPFYNAEKTIESCIMSASAQSYENIEIIAINDGSTDNSYRLLEKLSKNDQRIKVFTIENQGVSNARNIGIKKSTGEFIRFMDADDRIEPDSIEKLINAQETSNSDLVIGGYSIIQNDQVVSEVKWNKEEETTNIGEAIFWYKSKVLSPLWNKLFKRSLITNQFEMKYHVGEDLLFVLQYLENCDRISFISDSIYLYNAPTGIVNLSLQYHTTNTCAIMDCWDLFFKSPEHKKEKDEALFTLLFMNLLKGIDAKTDKRSIENEIIRITDYLEKNCSYGELNLPVQYRILPTMVKNKQNKMIIQYLRMLSLIKNEVKRCNH